MKREMMNFIKSLKIKEKIQFQKKFFEKAKLKKNY